MIHQIMFYLVPLTYKYFFQQKDRFYSRNINVTLKRHNLNIIHEIIQGQCPDELRWSGVQTSNL